MLVSLKSSTGICLAFLVGRWPSSSKLSLRLRVLLAGPEVARCALGFEAPRVALVVGFDSCDDPSTASYFRFGGEKNSIVTVGDSTLIAAAISRQGVSGVR